MLQHNEHDRTVDLPENRQERIAAIKSRRWSDLEMVLESIDNPHNIGAILRTCDAVGIEKVHLVYQDVRPPRLAEISGTAQSAAKWLDIRIWHDAPGCIADLKRRGLAIRVTALSRDGRPQWDFDWQRPSAIVMGNEAQGVSRDFLEAADGIVTIPMQGFVQSLNVSVAAATIMQEALRQRLSSPT